VVERSRLDNNADLEVTALNENLSASAGGLNRLTFIEIPVNEPMNDGITSRIKVRGASGVMDFGTFTNTAQGLALVALPASGYVTNINEAGPLEQCSPGRRGSLPHHLTDDQFALPGGWRESLWRRLPSHR